MTTTPHVRALPEVLREMLELLVRIGNPREYLVGEIMHYLDVLSAPQDVEVEALFESNGETKLYSPEDVNKLLNQLKKE